ncbi:MAG TPA: RagB/SusD family nutrient uptake outer membrane protein [Chitinophagaceae bacterium]|nr:RagB/SusD family nutrient uptake outer membrane protein [Chitinophagaceae bacterium]
MKRTKFFLIILLSATIFAACKKQLDIKNPNQPTPQSANTEQGIISLAQGGVYVNGFRDLKYGDGVFGLFWSGAIGFHELLGDVIQAEAANAFLNQIGVPDKVIFSDGSVILNPNNPQKWIDFERATNLNGNQGQNFLYYEWAYMYSLINAMNTTLDVVESVAFSGNGAAKKATIQAWAHYWKGFAYARIGSIYYSGLIVNAAGATNGNYLLHDKIIDESNSQLDQAAALLTGITSSADYADVLGRLIPSFNQVGKGGVLTTTEWKHSINTLKARNILVNTPVAQMTSAQWNSILTLTNGGITATDKILTGRSNTTSDFLSAAGSGTVSGKVQHQTAGGNTYKLSERWVQEFKPGDMRFTNNVKQTTTWIGNIDRGQAFNTRYTLINGGAGLPGVKVYANSVVGQYELYLAGSYEENALMAAEAKIYTGDVQGGLALVDAVRTYQGAGLTGVANTGLTQAQAIIELRRERRVALPFIGLSFYDARRWGIINPLSAGGGRKPAVVVKKDGTVDTGATIEYNYLDYWDVPDNELAYNPPASGSAPVKNPK